MGSARDRSRLLVKDFKSEFFYHSNFSVFFKKLYFLVFSVVKKELVGRGTGASVHLTLQFFPKRRSRGSLLPEETQNALRYNASFGRDT